MVAVVVAVGVAVGVAVVVVVAVGVAVAVVVVVVVAVGVVVGVAVVVAVGGREMTIDHDAIAARVRQDMKSGTPGLWRVGPVDDTIVTAADGSEVAAVDGDYNEPDLWPIMEANARRIATLPDLEEAYLDLYDEVKRLRADLRHVIDERDSTFALMLERAEKAEAERERLLYVLDGVAGAIDTGRNEPLQVWRDQINIARQALKGQTND